jgi:hypothetical protein
LRIVNQNITATTGLDGFLRRTRIAGDYDPAIGRIEPVPVTLHRMFGWKRGDSYVGVFIDDSWLDLMGIYLPAIGDGTLVPLGVGARLDVNVISLKQVLRHRIQADPRKLSSRVRRTNSPFT